MLRPGTKVGVTLLFVNRDEKILQRLKVIYIMEILTFEISLLRSYKWDKINLILTVSLHQPSIIDSLKAHQKLNFRFEDFLTSQTRMKPFPVSLSERLDNHLKWDFRMKISLSEFKQDFETTARIHVSKIFPFWIFSSRHFLIWKIQSSDSGKIVFFQ